jgi:bacteriocin biosynthesis cyclodehydratase domain-containing protein
VSSPRLALAAGFTILPGPDRVRLVCGEDRRYTLTAPGLHDWLPAWLPQLDGSRTLDEAVALLPAEQREAARQLAERLYGERVLIAAPPTAAHRAGRCCAQVEGTGRLAEALRSGIVSTPDAQPVPLLAQDNLDLDEALRFNERCLEGKSPWLWTTSGPGSRGYLSPVFLPDAGPCLRCLVRHFERLSPAPEVYADLIAHARQGKPIAPSPFPDHGTALLRDLVLWKVELLAKPDSPAALFRLHVLEVAALELTSHRVFFDPECPACRGHR